MVPLVMVGNEDHTQLVAAVASGRGRWRWGRCVYNLCCHLLPWQWRCGLGHRSEGVGASAAHPPTAHPPIHPPTHPHSYYRTSHLHLQSADTTEMYPPGEQLLCAA